MRSRCDRCKWKYPYGYLNRMFTNGGSTGPICGICAEEIMSEVHGQKVALQGEIAVEMRDKAIEYRKKNPGAAPQAGGKS